MKIVLLLACILCQGDNPSPSSPVEPEPSIQPPVPQAPGPAAPSPNPIPVPPLVTNPNAPANPNAPLNPNAPRNPDVVAPSPVVIQPAAPVEPAVLPVITNVVSPSGSWQPNGPVFTTSVLPYASGTPTTTSNSLESGLPSITIVAFVLVGLAIVILGIGVFIFKRYGFKSNNHNPFMKKHENIFSSTPLVAEKGNVMGDAFEPTTTQTQGFPQRLNKSNMYHYEQYQAAPIYNAGYNEGYPIQNQDYSHNHQYDQSAFGENSNDPFQMDYNQQYTYYPNAEYGYDQMPVQQASDNGSFTNSHPSLKFSKP